MDNQFRNAAFGGFNRQDVMDYLERTAKEHSEELAQLRARLDEDEKQLVRLEGETRHLVRSLSALTKAMWAAALSIFGVLLGFAVWYIQHLA